MAKSKKLREKLKNRSKFLVVAELTGGLNFNFSPIEKFLQASVLEEMTGEKLQSFRFLVEIA